MVLITSPLHVRGKTVVTFEKYERLAKLIVIFFCTKTEKIGKGESARGKKKGGGGGGGGEREREINGEMKNMREVNR